MTKLFTRVDVITALRKDIGIRSQKEWAVANNVSLSYVNDILQDHRAPGTKVLVALGFIYRERYERLK